MYVLNVILVIYLFINLNHKSKKDLDMLIYLLLQIKVGLKNKIIFHHIYNVFHLQYKILQINKVLKLFQVLIKVNLNKLH